MNNLALVYREQGRLDEAERLHDALAEPARRTRLGPNDARVAMGLHNLAAVYRQQGRIDEARPLQERAVAVADQALGPRRTPTRSSFRNRLAALGTAPRAESGRNGSPSAPVPRAAGKSALPPPPLVEPDPPAASAGGGFAVQVAAVPRADQVPGEWRRLVKRHPDLRALELQPAQSVEVAGKGTFYRVIAGPLRFQGRGRGVVRAAASKAGAACRLARS